MAFSKHGWNTLNPSKCSLDADADYIPWSHSGCLFHDKGKSLETEPRAGSCAYIARAKPSFMGQDLCDDCPLCQHSAGP